MLYCKEAFVSKIIFHIRFFADLFNFNLQANLFNEVGDSKVLLDKGFNNAIGQIFGHQNLTLGLAIVDFYVSNQFHIHFRAHYT